MWKDFSALWEAQICNVRHGLSLWKEYNRNSSTYRKDGQNDEKTGIFLFGAASLPVLFHRWGQRRKEAAGARAHTNARDHPAAPGPGKAGGARHYASG